MTELSPRTALAALLATLLVCGLWPYHEMLGWLPWGADASKWVGQGSLDNPGWASWVWGSKHFVGYRPVTALSFVLNQATTGYSALGYRATDLLLHLLTAALLLGVHRALTGDRTALGLLTVVLLCGHPATEEVVPYAARRSYLLATVGGLSALLLWTHALTAVTSRARWALACASALCLGLGLLSNEVAYVFVPLLPLVWLLWGPPAQRRGLWLHLPALVVLGGALVARYVVLGRLGGYHHRYFATLVKGVPMWREMSAWEPWAILQACWTYLLAPNGVSGQLPLLQGALGTAALGLFTGWLLWVALRPGEGRRVRLLLLVWLLGALALVVLSQTWFWRQAHSLLLPMSMLAALGTRDGLQALQQRRREAISLLVGSALVLSCLWSGPLWTGMDLRPHTQTILGTPLVQRVRALLVQIPRGVPTTVWLVVPLRANGSHMLRMWSDLLGKRKGVHFRLLAHLRPHAHTPEARLDILRDTARPRLVLGQGLMFVGSKALPAREPGGALEVDRLWREGEEGWVFALDADDSWAVRLEGVEGAEGMPEEEGEDTGVEEGL
jgi:hypothetical protein